MGTLGKLTSPKSGEKELSKGNFSFSARVELYERSAKLIKLVLTKS
jgi:hypothetical protein